MYSASIPQLTKMLRNMAIWIQKAEVLAGQKNFDVNTLLNARLAPDMFPLVRQFQSSCDTAKFIGARLAEKAPPSDPDTETTFAELRARIEKTIGFLDTIKEADFKNAAATLVQVNYLPANKRIQGDVYLYENALPNFYFHACMAYAILRGNGVDVGKMDYLGSFPLVDV